MCFLKYFISKWQLRSKNSIALSSPSVIMKHYYNKDHRCMLIRINELMNNGHLVREPASHVKFMRACRATYFLKVYLANMEKNLKYNNTSQRFRND